MAEFLGTVEYFQHYIKELPHAELRKLADDLERAAPPLPAAARAALASEQAAALLPNHVRSLLEHLFERWSVHGPAVKLALIAYLIRLKVAAVDVADVLAGHPELHAAVRQVAEECVAAPTPA